MIDRTRCPLCENTINHNFALRSKENSHSLWYLCRCGYMFHKSEYQPEKVFNAEYLDNFNKKKFGKERYEYMARLYAQIIEEKTYGRRMLDVGSCTGQMVNIFRGRGWLATGIDLMDNPFIKGDFETYDFESEKFDLIWLSDVIQCFIDPIEALYKAYDLLRPDGLMFICTPNTDLIWHDQISSFGHWDMTTQKQFINERILRDILIKADASMKSRVRFLFMDQEVTSQRFMTWNTMHAIIQKKFIIDNPAYSQEREEYDQEKQKEVHGKHSDRGDNKISVGAGQNADSPS